MTNVKSAQRTLEILELLERLRKPARVSQIARLLGYPQSSTSVLINSLKDLGYLNYDPETYCYAPSIRVALVGGYLRFNNLHAYNVLDLLFAIQKTTRYTTVLCSRNGVYAQYVYVIPAPGRGIEGLRAGSLRPLTRIAAGIALLAECGEDEIGRIVRHINAMADSRQRESLDEVLSLVRDTRGMGFASLAGGLTPGIGSVAVTLPFHDSFGKPLVVSVAGPADEILSQRERLAGLVLREIRAHCSGAH